MKKLMVALLLAVLGLSVMDTSAFYRRCWRNNNCNRCEKRCEPKCERACEPCARPCKVDFVEEEACPQPPCCVRYVRVEEPAEVTKHVNYTVACPTGCTPEEKAAGMMNAGETWEQGKTAKANGKY